MVRGGERSRRVEGREGWLRLDNLGSFGSFSFGEFSENRFVSCLGVQREENAKNEEGTREEEEDASSRKLLQFRFPSTPSSESSAVQTDFSKR